MPRTTIDPKADSLTFRIPPALKADLGSTVIEMGMADVPEATRAEGLLSRVSGGHAERDGSTVRLSPRTAHAC